MLTSFIKSFAVTIKTRNMAGKYNMSGSSKEHSNSYALSDLYCEIGNKTIVFHKN